MQNNCLSRHAAALQGAAADVHAFPCVLHRCMFWAGYLLVRSLSRTAPAICHTWAGYLLMRAGSRALRMLFTHWGRIYIKLLALSAPRTRGRSR